MQKFSPQTHGGAAVTGRASLQRGHTPQSALAQLERVAGNAAVSSLLRSAGTVQRWEGPEHERIGNAADATIDLGNGVVLSWGAVVAIAGDEHGNVEELLRDTRTAEVRAQLRARLQHAEVQDPRVAGLPAPSRKQTEDTSRYDQLAAENVPHFAAGGTAISTWRRHHTIALDQALPGGFTGMEDIWQQAQLTEAFGQHFLTDSFSAGHVRTPGRKFCTGTATSSLRESSRPSSPTAVGASWTR